MTNPSEKPKRFDIEFFLDAVTAAIRPRPSVRELWCWWQTTPEARFITNRASIHSRMRKWILPALGEVLAGELTADQVERALEVAARAGKSAQTINHCIVDLRRLLRAARGARKWPGPDPMEFVRRRKLLPAKRATLTAAAAAELLAGVVGKYRVIFALAIFLGLRKGEVLALERSDVDLVQLELAVTKSHGRKCTKNGGARTLPICSQLEPILRAWLAPAAAGDGCGELVLFPGKGTGGRMGVDAAISKRLRFALETVGQPRPTIRFHDLRHTFSTLADDAGIAEEVVSQVLGHCPSVTARYTHRRISRLRQQLERLQVP